MSRRQIRVRPVRREQINLRRLAVAIASLVAENARQQAVADPTKTSEDARRRVA